MAELSLSEQELLPLLRLNLIPGVGSRTQTVLLERFGSAEGVLSASIEQLLQVRGVGRKLAAAISLARETDEALQELERCRQQGVQLFLRERDGYPKMLTEIPDPPPVLYCRGTLLPSDELSVALVGSRRCTVYGRQQAERLANALARAGLTVISGLARGIDAAAHRGALAAKGRTIAVSATGLAQVYPPEHKDLARQIEESGAVLSESRLDQRPVAGLFPQRNRIISGLSLGVIVIEATRNSGALHTARHAMEQGREVMALPGRVDSLASEGCHALIRDGATLVRNADDVLEVLGPPVEPVSRTEDDVIHTPRELTLNDQERKVLNLISNEPRHIDEILGATDIEASRVLATLTVLEMKRLVQRLPGSMVVRRLH